MIHCFDSDGDGKVSICCLDFFFKLFPPSQVPLSVATHTNLNLNPTNEIVVYFLLLGTHLPKIGDTLPYKTNMVFETIFIFSHSIRRFELF